MVFCDHS